MDINTGKLMSNSNTFFNKVKESETKISRVDFSKIKKKLSGTMLDDLNEVNIKDDSVKTKFIKMNNLLTEYERQFSEMQYADQKLKKIEELYEKKDLDQIKDIIKNSLFDNRQILKDYVGNLEEIGSGLVQAKQKITDKFALLDNEVKKIEVTSQNFLSMYKMPIDIPKETLGKINFEDLIKSSSLNKKRVLELIS